MVRQEQCRPSRYRTKRSQHSVTRYSSVAVLSLCLLLSYNKASGQIFQTAGPTHYGDDLHTAKVNPFPAIAISTIASTPPGQCAWINTALNAFITANPANGTGPSHQGWSFDWAGVADEAKVEAGITITSYFPFVVTPPAVTAANGATAPKGASGELGGAVFNLKYTPKPGAPVINNLHWIQAYTGTLYGNPFGPILDNDPAHPYSAQSSVSPFYDTNFFAGTLPNGGGYFVDRPQVPENEYEQNPIVSAEFQVVLVGDETSVVNGITQNKLTLYGGEWWGFTYSATDVPEPSAFAICIIGSGGFFLFRRVNGKKRVS